MERVGIFVAARVLLASVFFGYGLEGLLRNIGVLPSAGFDSPSATAMNSGVLIAGLLLAVGWQTRWLALALALYILVDAFVSHPFWRFSGAEQHELLLHFLKNLAILGGLLLLAWAVSSRSAGKPSFLGKP